MQTIYSRALSSRVLVPYCSSDGWLGSRPFTNLAFQFNYSADADNFAFRGHVIFQAVINELVSLYNLSNSSELVLVWDKRRRLWGVLNHLPGCARSYPVRKSKPSWTSSWFIDFGGRDGLFVVAAWFWRPSRTSKHARIAHSTTHVVFSPSCLFHRSYLTDSLNIPIFLISSLYDIYVLSDTLNALLKDSATTVEDLLRTFNSYGALMNASILQTASATRTFPYTLRPASQHIYLATSSLWSPSNGILNATENGTYQEGDFWLKNYIRNGSWNEASIFRGFLQKRKVRFPPPQHKIGISCLDLTYQVEVVNKPKLAGKARHMGSNLCSCCHLSASKVIPVTPKGATPDSGRHSDTNHSHGSATDIPLQNHTPSGKKTILSDVNFYVNPGELVCHHGTLRLWEDYTAGYSAGQKVLWKHQDSVKNWFVLNSGYVRQLAVSFYSELTVRQNLLLAMTMQSQKGQSTFQILERVEQTGLQGTADVRVGNESGLGISGGQKRKLAIAVQLLSLDSASSLEVLYTLRQLVDSGRTVVVTIHQPRSKVFHMFDKILFLSEGKVAFFGSPLKVFEFINNSLRQQVMVPDVRSLTSGDPHSIKQAVKASKTPFTGKEPTTLKRNPGLWQRIMSLEARASLRQSKFSVVYLPILHDVFQHKKCSSNSVCDVCVELLQRSVHEWHRHEPPARTPQDIPPGVLRRHCLQLRHHPSHLCQDDGHLPLPLLACFVIIASLVYHSFALTSFLSILLTFLVDNQVWVALFIVIGVLFPAGAARICAVLSAIGGFFCGFIVPVPNMPAYYRWITYINPSYYSYSAIGAILLSEREQLDCGRDSKLECFSSSGLSLLRTFGLESTNPFENLLVMAAMTLFLVVLGVLMLVCRMRYPGLHLYSRVAWLWRVCCRRGTRSRGTTSPLLHPSNQPAAPLMCHAQFLTNDGVHVVFSGDGEEETGLTPEVHRGRLLSDAYLPLQRQASKMAAATNKSDVVIVEDEEERLRITAQRVRDRRERMNNEIRRLKHFNSIIGREGDPQGMSLHNRCS
eukprot:Em0567g1a